MNATQRMKALLNGEKTDRPGVTVWKHIYLEDRHPVDFVKRTIELQEANQWDFIKISYNGLLMPEAFGSTIQWSEDYKTFPRVVNHTVNNPMEWLKLTPASVKEGPLRREIDATARMVEHFKGEVPILPTIFSPLTSAQEISCGFQNPWPIIADMKYSGKELHKGLEVVTETTLRFVEELTKVGVDGIFLATHFAAYNRTTLEQYNEFARPYDMQVLDSIKDKTWLNLMHIHGTEELFFKEIADYPVQGFNWEDISSNISLKDARAVTDKLLIGGIEQLQDFNERDRDKLKEKLRARVKQAREEAGDKLVIAPGCCIPSDVPEYRFTVLKEVMDEIAQ